MNYKQQALDILNGKEKPPTEFISYLVGRACEARDEGNKIVDKIKETEAMLRVLRLRAQELQGAANSYAEDIETWLAKEGDGEAEPQLADEAKAKPQLAEVV